MSKLNDTKILSFRRFERADADTEITYDIAWPVEVVECYANKATDGELDALAETVLELLTVSEMSYRKIASLLMISEQVVKMILSSLEAKEYYSEKKVTDKGKAYLQDKEVGEFTTEKVFGNIFISLMDGEVFPYFYPGKLPWAIRGENIYTLSFDNEIDRIKAKDKKDIDLIDKVNRAYHRFGKINKMSQDQRRDSSKREIEFYEESLVERDFCEPETLEEAEEIKNLGKARVKILDTERRRVYIKTRFTVKKADPEKFIVESPFPINVTSWYADSFRRMRENNELIYDPEFEELGLDYFCENITTKFYVDYPELQSTNFEQYIKVNFPNMRNSSVAEVLLAKYREVFNLNILCREKHQVKRHAVITESAKAIELILNNYVANTDKASIVRKYETVIRRKEDIESMLKGFKIKDCMAKRKELHSIGKKGVIVQRLSIFNSFRKYAGKTVLEKYYYLIAEAYFNENSKFRKLLFSEGIEIIKMLDYINEKRNKYGAHNDGLKPVEIPQEDYRVYQDYFKKVTVMLINYMD